MEDYTVEQIADVFRSLNREDFDWIKYLITDFKVMERMGYPTHLAMVMIREKHKLYRSRHKVSRIRPGMVPISAYTDFMWERCLNSFDHQCAYCGARPGLLPSFRFVREHFIPITNPACPGATPDNIVPSCLSCNSSKNDNDARSWLTTRYGERKALRILARIEAYFDTVQHHLKRAETETTTAGK
jgi:hypothetical protein